MATSHSLSLSNLRASTEYPLLAGTAERKCLIHVKMTEACAHAIDGLLRSEKVNYAQRGRAEREGERQNLKRWKRNDQVCQGVFALLPSCLHKGSCWVGVAVVRKHCVYTGTEDPLVS